MLKTPKKVVILFKIIEYTVPTYSLSITINLLSTNDFKTKLQSHIPSVTYGTALQEEWE